MKDLTDLQKESQVLAQQKTSGFTLYEFVIALTIGSIILILAVPGFNGVMDNQRMTRR